MAPGAPKMEEFQSVLAKLPQANYDTLKMLIQHLDRYVIFEYVYR